MFDTGRLALSVLWDGERVQGTEIASTRPMASQILKGKTPTQVMQLVPLLFSVCGRAQGAAASVALLAAMREQSPAVAAMQRSIACEAMQEHLWRLTLDWPELLGLPQQDRTFAAWYGQLRAIGAGEAEMVEFLPSFERDALGMKAAQWCTIQTYADMQRWWQQHGGPLGQVLARLDGLPQAHGALSPPRLLPAWSAQETQRECSGKWDMAFAAQPEWQGRAAETGAWSYYADTPLLQDVWQQSGSKPLTRMLARVLDLVTLADGAGAVRLDMASPAADEGIATVRTARGLLLHHVKLDGDNVAEYHIVAPTEWNFHPHGAFAQDLAGGAEHDGGLLEFRAQVEAMSLDPCVPYEVEIKGADDA